MGRVEMPVAVVERVQKTCVPGLSRPKRDLKAQSAIGIHRLRRRMRRNDGYGPAEISVAIGGPKLLSPWRPLGGNPPAAQDVTRLHLEDIGEVATNGDLQLELNRFHAVIHDVEIFVHAAID